MGKILLIENDIQTITAVSTLVTMLGHETLIIHNWPSHVKALETERPLAVIVNVEMATVRIEKIFESFPQGLPQSVPVFYLYNRTFAPNVVKAQKFPHAGGIKKPIQLEILYELLGKEIDFKTNPSFDTSYQAKLHTYKNVEAGFTEWIGQLNVLLKKQVY